MKLNCFESIYSLHVHCQHNNLDPDPVKILKETLVQIGNRDFNENLSDSSVWDYIGINVHWAVDFCLTDALKWVRLAMSFYVYNS